MRKIFFTLFLVCLSFPTLSQINKKPDGKSCTTQEGRLEYINKLTSQHYDWLLRKVERVPPDIEKYISSEYTDSIETRNEVKYNNVVSNKFFYSWTLRNSINKLIEESKDGYSSVKFQSSLQSDPREIEIIYYTNLLNKNYDVKESYDTYGRYDRNRKPRVLNEEKDSFTFSVWSSTYQMIIQDLIRCSFKK